MLTLLFSLGKMNGCGFILFGVLLCTAFYLAVALPLGKRPLRALTGLLAAEIVTDSLWAVWFYEGTKYVNPGLGGAAVLLLWPLALLLALPFALGGKAKWLCLPLLLALVLTVQPAPLEGNISGAEWEKMEVDGSLYEQCLPEGLSGADRGRLLGTLRSGGTVFRLYEVPGYKELLYRLWDW